MSEADVPENPAPEETSTPAEARADLPDTTAPPAGATGGEVPDAKPAEKPVGAAADDAEAAPAGAAAEEQPEAEVPAPREPDPLRDPIVEQLTSALGDGVLASEVAKGDLTVRVTNATWRRTVEWCKANGFTYFCFLSGIDWLANPELANRYETLATEDERRETLSSTTFDTGVAGGDTRFQVLCRLFDVNRKVGITLKADLDSDAPAIESVTGVFRGADWHERETWEMFGFDFAGHPGLRHLYLPTEFEGFPLRKDFPLLARAVKPWPGLVDKEPVPGEDEEEEVAAT